MAFADAWVVPGGEVESQDRSPGHETEALAAKIRRAAVRELREEVGVELRDEDLRELWELETATPTGRRYRVHYFDAVLPAGHQPAVDGVELTGLRWCRPSDAIAAADQGQLLIPPATLETLERLVVRDREHRRKPERPSS